MTNRHEGNKIKLVIFDCDGVVIDSEILSANVLIEMLADLGTSIDQKYIYNNFLGRSFPTVAKFLKDNLSVDLPQNFEQHYRELLMTRCSAELLPIENVTGVLTQLNVPYCLASSSSPERIERTLEITSITDFFTQCTFTASLVKNGKPAPDLFLYAAKKMNVLPEHCLVIEDSSVGLQAAKAANMQAIWFSGGSHIKAVKAERNSSQAHGLVDHSIRELEQFGKFFDLFPQLNGIS